MTPELPLFADRAGAHSLPADLERRLFDLLDDTPSVRRSQEVDRLCDDHPAFAGEIRASLRDAAGGLQAGDLVGEKYRIVRLLGRGGFGGVYEARDEAIGSRVAIKFMHARSRSERFGLRNEAWRLSRVDHPNIVGWKLFDEHRDGSCYFVMEFVDGESLDVLLQREQRLAPRRACELLLQIAAALRAAHHGGTETILHLDLKPHNVLVTRSPIDGREHVKVIDFGIGQYAGDPAPGGAGERTEATLRTTASAADGTGPGWRCTACTPEYASPEQAAHFRGEAGLRPLDGRSDLYSLGVMAYRMLAGELPFDPPDSRLGWLDLHRNQPPHRLTAGGARVPRRLVRFVERCLQKDPELRWPDAAAAYAALQRIAQRPPWRTWSLVAASTAAIAVSALSLAGRPAPLPRLPLRAAPSAGPGAPLRVLDGDRVWFGPARRAVTLRLPPQSRPWPVLRVVADPRPGAPAVPGWRATWLAGDRVRLSAERPRPPGGELYLALAPATDGAERLSSGLRPSWLAPDAWRIDAADVPGRNGRAVFAATAELRVDVAPASGDRAQLAEILARVSVRPLDGGAPPREIPPRPQAPGSFALALGELCHRRGTHNLRLEVEVEDRAGNRHAQRIAVPVVDRPLALGDPELTAPHSHGVYYLYRGARPRLRARTGLRADVVCDASWGSRVLGLDLATDATGRLDVPLDALMAALQGHADLAGTLVVRADADRYIAGAGEARQRDLEFRYFDRTPGIHLEVGGTTASPAEPVFLRDSQVAVRLTPDLPVPIEVAVVVTPAGGSPRPAQELAFADDRPRDLPLRLSDGRNDVGVELRERTPDRRRIDRAGYALVLDRTPPSLDLGGLPAGWVRDLDHLRARIKARDATPAGCAPTPLTVLYRLEDERGEALCRRTLQPTADGTCRLPIDAIAARGEARDGRYRVQVRVRDRAGNEVAGERTLAIATDGPRLDVADPRTGPHGQLEVSVAADDPNGVDAVTATLVDDRDSRRLDVALQAQGGGRWRGHVQLGASWSGAGARLTVEARDRGGAARRVQHPFEIAAFEPRDPARLDVTRGELHTGAMELVAGNRLVHRFGGTRDPALRERLEKLGLTSWDLDVAAGRIPPFYLDERAVTAARYLAFLAAPDGWSTARHWPGGAAPGGARRRALTAWLRSRPPDAAATRVTWQEAAAYAHWAGKRLPTLLEWDYATSRPESPLPGAVAEWTATPDDFDGDALGPGAAREGAALHLARHLDDLLQADTEWPASARWVAGNPGLPPALRRFAVAPRAAASESEQFGFRCALSVAAARRGLEAGPEREVRITAAPR